MAAFKAFDIGVTRVSVCTSLALEQATQRLNREEPLQPPKQWVSSQDSHFDSGQRNPCVCCTYPDNKHYLFTWINVNGD